MRRAAWILAGVLPFLAGAAGATTIVCADPSFPQHVEGGMRVDSDGSDEQRRYTILMPESYQRKPLVGAWIEVRGADGALVRTPVETEAIDGDGWRSKRVAVIQAAKGGMPVKFIANYGEVCVYILSVELD